MCDKRNSKKVFLNSIGERKLDDCIADLVVRLNSSNVRTLGSCCGHGKYPMTIVAVNRMGINYEFISGTEIPRKRRFYLKDKKGFYYIPEVCSCLKD